MRLIRASLLGFLFISWLPATNACALASAFPQVFADCCGETTLASDGSLCGEEGSCNNCTTMETGLFLVVIHPVSVLTPLEQHNEWLLRFMAELAGADDESSRVIDANTDPPASPLLQIVLQRALPVRAPSIS